MIQVNLSRKLFLKQEQETDSWAYRIGLWSPSGRLELTDVSYYIVWLSNKGLL